MVPSSSVAEIVVEKGPRGDGRRHALHDWHKTVCGDEKTSMQWRGGGAGGDWLRRALCRWPTGAHRTSPHAHT